MEEENKGDMVSVFRAILGRRLINMLGQDKEQQVRKKGNMIAAFKAVKERDEIDKDLLVRTKK